MAVLEQSCFKCFKGIIQQSRKHKKKKTFLLLFRDQNNVEVLGNITMVTSFNYNIHTLAIFFSPIFCLSKSLRKDFLCKVNHSDFQRTIL